MRRQPIGYLLLLLLLVSSAIGITRSRNPRTGLGIYPEVASFAASQESIAAGEPVTLTWETRGTQSVTIDYGSENTPRARMQHLPNLPVQGSMKLSPVETTVYQLSCVTISDGSMCLPAAVTVKVEGSAINAKLN